MKNSPFNKGLFGLAAALAFFSGQQRASAHPHVWIDVVTDVLFTKDGKVIGLKHSWTFDESYSVLAVQGLDKDKNRKLSAQELAPLLRKSLASLKDWNYFSHIKINGRSAALKKLRNPTIGYNKGQIVMGFELLMDKPADTAREDVRLTVYDRSFYNLLSFADKDPIWLGRNAPDSCGFIIEPSQKGNSENTEVADSYIESLGKDVNYGAQFAEWVKLDCRPQ